MVGLRGQLVGLRWLAPHPLTFRQRVIRRLHRIARTVRRGRGLRDYETMRWLVGPYTGTTEISRALYINLDISPDRRASMERRLAAVGAPAERFRAIHGATERANYEDYIAQRPPLPPSRRPSGEPVPYPVTDGMIGNWLSQVELLKHISSLEPGLYLILEDDYSLPDDWRARVRRLLAEIPDDWDLLKLYNGALNPKPPHRGVRVSQHLMRLGPALLTQQNLSVSAYVVRHSGARVSNIVQLFENAPIMHIDDALNFIMDDLRVYAARKPIGRFTPLSNTRTHGPS